MPLFTLVACSTVPDAQPIQPVVDFANDVQREDSPADDEDIYSWPPPRPAVDRWGVADEFVATFPVLKQEDLNRETFIFYFALSCGMLEAHSQRLETLTRRLGLHHLFVAGGPDASEWLGLTGMRIGAGGLAVFENGKVVDIISGDYLEPMYLHFFARNGLIDHGPQFVDWRDSYDWASTIGIEDTRYHDAQDLRGRDLRKIMLTRGSASGADLRKADLRGVNMTGANLSRANLTGARLEGANVTNVQWFGAICPDGSSAEDHTGRTCEGHLVLGD